MKSLTNYITEKLVIFPSQVNEKLVIRHQPVDEKLIIFPSQVNEKLVINKDYNYSGLDDIYDLEWNLNRYGLYCKDTDNVASNTFYEYFVNSATKKISFAQQCRYANHGYYLCALKELMNGSHLMYLFHLNWKKTLNNANLLYSKFVFIPVHNGMRIEYNDYVPKKEVYSLSKNSHFSKDDSTPEYYLESEDTWNEIETLYKNLCKQ